MTGPVEFTCCGICANTARLLDRGRRLDDITDWFALDATTIAARLRAHGHTALAARIAPAPRTATAAPVQGVLELGRIA